MKDSVQGKNMIIEEIKATKVFMWLFYIIFFTYEIFYYLIRPMFMDKKIGIPEDGLGIWFYILLLSLLPFGIYFIKKGKPHLVKYIFFVSYVLLDFINVLMEFYGQNKPFADGNVIEVFVILFASIFVNKRYVWIIFLGITIKYLLIGLILQDVNVFLPIGVYFFLLLVTLIILSRFLSYIKSLTSAYEEIRNKEKLAFLGQMATSVGHEIRNPLSALKGFTQLQQERDTSENTFYPIMIQEIDRINSIVDDLMILGKPKSPNFKSHEINIILDYVTSVSNQLAESYGTKILVNHCEDLPKIDCDEKQMKQVFINIIKNAIESMPSGGVVEVSCSLKEKGKLKIIVQDQGCGIDADKVKKLGEPFYTTKQDGTGLGLLVTKKIIDDHQGKIHFESQIGIGTKVTITLPIKHTQN